MQAILRWSALPGASRHHWGTDIDVYDRGCSSGAAYALQLTEADERLDKRACSARCIAGWIERIATDYGVMAFFALTRRIALRHCAGAGWHLSFAPLAVRYQRQLTRGCSCG